MLVEFSYCFFCNVFLGPSQNPVGLQQPPGVGYGMTHQAAYNPMQSKAPLPSAPGLYPSGTYQAAPPISAYQPGPPPTSYPAPMGQPLLPRPPMGSPASHTPPQSASPSPRPPTAQATPPPPAVSSSSYYPNPQQPPLASGWQSNTAPRHMGPLTPMSTPPRGPLANHVNPAPSATVPPLSGAYGSVPPPSAASYGSAPPPPPPPAAAYSPAPPAPVQGMPPTSTQGFSQPGRNTEAPQVQTQFLIHRIKQVHD